MHQALVQLSFEAYKNLQVIFFAALREALNHRDFRTCKVWFIGIYSTACILRVANMPKSASTSVEANFRLSFPHVDSYGSVRELLD